MNVFQMAEWRKALWKRKMSFYNESFYYTLIIYAAITQKIEKDYYGTALAESCWVILYTKTEYFGIPNVVLNCLVLSVDDLLGWFDRLNSHKNMKWKCFLEATNNF